MSNTLNSPGSVRNPGMTLAQHLELTQKLGGMNPNAQPAEPAATPAPEQKTASAAVLELTDENLLKVAMAESPRLAALYGASADYGLLVQDEKIASDELAAGIGSPEAVKVAEENLLTFLHAALVDDPAERAKIAAACGVTESDLTELADGAPERIAVRDGKVASETPAPTPADVAATINKFLVPAG